MSTFFMIRHKPTGLFSKGGEVNYDSAVLTQEKLETLTHHGKVWHTIGPLRSHLNIAKYNDDFEVVECVIQVINTCTISEQREIAAKNRKKREDARERINASFHTLLQSAPQAPAVPYGVDEEAANRIALAVYDCKHGINQEPLLYAINRILATEAHPISAE